MSEQISVGDVVMLKSGGPKMTVSNIDKYGYEDRLSAACDWFTQEKAPWKKEADIFPLTSLKKITD